MQQVASITPKDFGVALVGGGGIRRMHGTLPPSCRFRGRHENFAEHALAPRVSPGVLTNTEIDMRTIVLVLSLVALAVPSQAATKLKARDDGATTEQKCRDMVGKEQSEGEGRGGVGRLQAQRFGECMMGVPH